MNLFANRNKLIFLVKSCTRLHFSHVGHFSDEGVTVNSQNDRPLRAFGKRQVFICAALGGGSRGRRFDSPGLNGFQIKSLSFITKQNTPRSPHGRALEKLPIFLHLDLSQMKILPETHSDSQRGVKCLAQGHNSSMQQVWSRSNHQPTESLCEKNDTESKTTTDLTQNKSINNRRSKILLFFFFFYLFSVNLWPSVSSRSQSRPGADERTCGCQSAKHFKPSPKNLRVSTGD
ncbi:hypothetical protein NL108_005482 [Boleophthalmus pectinirostris]|nr:hypothetical protein NL108_005482 [Boleophthalmus pectinirostris]